MNLSQKYFKLMLFVVSNFGPILVFYGANAFFGLKTAVALSVVWTLSDLVRHLVLKKRVSLFFGFSAAVTLVFGVVDLYLQKTMLFKYEASLTSAAVGLFFALSLLGEKPLIREFAEAQGRVSNEVSLETEFYFKFMTGVWAVVSLVKAAFYFWVAGAYSLEEGLAIRATVGTLSFYGLLGISIFGARYIKAVLSELGFPRRGHLPTKQV